MSPYITVSVATPRVTFSASPVESGIELDSCFQLRWGQPSRGPRPTAFAALPSLCILVGEEDLGVRRGALSPTNMKLAQGCSSKRLPEWGSVMVS